MWSVRIGRRWGLLGRALLSAGFLGLLFYYVGPGVFSEVARARWEVVALVVAILASNVLVVTPRWANILSALGYPIRSAALVGSVAVGFFFNQVLPTGVGGDVLRAWRARDIGVPLGVAINSVLIDRAAGVAVSLLGSLALLPFARPQMGGPLLLWVVGISFAAVLLGGLALWGVSRMRIRRFSGRPQAWLATLATGVWALVTHPPSAAAVLALACLNQLLPVIAIGLLARELHVTIAAVDVALITFVSTLLATVPLSIGGWGVREGTLVVLFALYGIAPETALAISTLYGGTLTLSSAPGVLVLLRRSRSMAVPSNWANGAAERSEE